VTISVKNLTASVERGDGIGLLKRLQTMNASATPADRNHALKQFQELQMHNKEAIIHFVSRFQSHRKVLADATLDSKHRLTCNELSTYFIDKLCANMSMVGDVRHRLLDLKNQLESETSTKTLTNLEDKLCKAETQTQTQRGASRPPSHNSSARDATCSFCSKRGHKESACYSNPSNQRTQRHQANYTQQTNGNTKQANTAGAATKCHGPKCFHCKGPHVLNKCPQATEEQKEQLCRKHLGPRTNQKHDRDRGNGRRTSAPSSSSHQANQVVQPPETTEEQANTARAINTGRSSRAGVSWARGCFAAVIEDLHKLSDN
jgi:hypothetical protein